MCFCLGCIQCLVTPAMIKQLVIVVSVIRKFFISFFLFFFFFRFVKAIAGDACSHLVRLMTHPICGADSATCVDSVEAKSSGKL